MRFISIEKYKDIDKFKKELQKLEEFITDNEWLTMLKYDIALNPDLSDEISKIIDYINVDTFTAEDYNDLILKLKDECIKLKNDADSCDDKIEKWYKYRHAYAYYGMIEVITEGSIITEKILDEFKRKYGDNYLDELKKITANHTGFIKAMWCGSEDCENKLKEEYGITSRCKPFEQEVISNECVCCGKHAEDMLIWGKAY